MSPIWVRFRAMLSTLCSACQTASQACSSHLGRNGQCLHPTLCGQAGTKTCLWRQSQLLALPLHVCLQG